MAGFGGGFRSAPVSPGEYLRSIEYDVVIRAVAERYLGTDHFSRDENIRYRGLRAAATFGGLGDRDGWGIEEAIRIDDVRRINAMAQMVNSIVTPQMRHAEIHPKLSPSSGQFPRDFEIPKRVEAFLIMDNPSLDRILLSYNLPRDSSLSPLPSPLRRLDRDRDYFGDFNLEDTRRVRLLTLFEYLGVDVSGERRFGDLVGGARLLGGGRVGGVGGRGLGG